MVVAFGIGYGLARVFDQGVANLLGLCTLRHGTNPLSWISIHLIGGRPGFGGTKIGGDTEYKNASYLDNRDRFYMVMPGDMWGGRSFLRRDASAIVDQGDEKRKWYGAIVGICIAPCISALYKYSSTKAFIRESGKIDGVLAKVLAVVGLVLPSIKIRVGDEKVKTFHEDSTYPRNMCAFSKRVILPWDIGALGTLCNGFSLQVFDRMVKHPFRVALGIAEIALAVLGTITFPSVLVANSIAVVAGAFFGVI